MDSLVSIFLKMLSVLALLVLLPVLAYMVVKFGTAGYLKAKQRQQEKEKAKSHVKSAE